MRRRFLLVPAVGVALLLLTACTSTPAVDADAGTTGSDTPASACGGSDGTDDQRFPDVLAAELEPRGDDFMISVTLCSPYDTAERYADGWRVLTPAGEVLAEHGLAHDHADEQPFTRTRGPFAIPDEIADVTVEGRDRVNGYGGETVTIDVPH